MPAYKATYLEQALDSLLAQTYPALGLVIGDDNADGGGSWRASAPWPALHSLLQE